MSETQTPPGGQLQGQGGVAPWVRDRVRASVRVRVRVRASVRVRVGVRVRVRVRVRVNYDQYPGHVVVEGQGQCQC